jgi:uncharacterized delta-60 repeat protein
VAQYAAAVVSRETCGGLTGVRALAAAGALCALLLAAPAAARAADGKLSMQPSVGNTQDYANSVAIQSDDKIVVAGQTLGSAATGTDFLVARFNTNGTLDTSFGGDGIVTTAISPGASVDEATDLAIQGDGKIVVVGAIQPTGGGQDFAVARYNADGSLDTGFGGGDGIVTQAVAAGSGTDQADAVAIQSNGAIVVAGSDFSAGKFALVRLEPDGDLDTSFDGDGGSGNGVVTIDVSDQADVADDVAIESDQQIVVAGLASPGGAEQSAFVRLNPDGTLDVPVGTDGTAGDFSTDGIQLMDLSPSNYEELFNLAVQSDGKIVASGEADFLASGADISLVRLTDAGAPDAAFGGGDGIATTSIAPGAENDAAFGMALDGTSGILVASESATDTSGHSDFALVRYKQTDGSLDSPGFDFDGITIVDIADDANDTPFYHGLAIRPSTSTAVAAGAAPTQNNLLSRNVGLIRLSATTGVLDTAFDGDTSPPDTSFVSGVTDGGFTSDSTPAFGFSSTETLAAYACSLDAAVHSVCNQGAGLQITTPLADGQHTLAVEAIDRFINIDASAATRTFTVDTADPNTTVAGKRKKRSRKRRARFTFALGSTDAGSTFRCKLDARAEQACSSPFSVRVKRGKHTLLVRATDRAGNVDDTPASIVFRLLKKR